MAEATIIRASALSSWPDCNRRGAARLFRSEIEAAGYRLRHIPRGIGAAIGTAVHKAAQVLLGEKAASGVLPPASVATDAALDELHAQLGTGEIAYDVSFTLNRNEATRQAISMTHIYRSVVAPKVEPILVEERLEAEVAPGLVLSGHADVVAREPGAVRDLKTGVRRPASVAPQLGAYSLLSRSHGLDITRALIDFIQRVRPARPQPDPLSSSLEVAQAETAATNILRHIEGDLATFRHGDPARQILPGDPWAFQANPASVLCGEKYCPCWGTTGSHSFCNEWQPKDG